MVLFRSLETFVRPRAVSERAAPRCELCSAPIGESHRHVCELAARAVRCACRACAVLFGDPGAGGGRFRTVPERVLEDPAFVPTDAEWSALGIPVRIAYVVFQSAVSSWMAFYPSPGGSIEAPVADPAWRALAARSPLVAALEPDVEALLVHRRPGGRADSFLAPVDACYALTAVVRRHWEGFHGGDRVWHEIDAFFDDLRARSRPVAAEGDHP